MRRLAVLVAAVGLGIPAVAAAAPAYAAGGLTLTGTNVNGPVGAIVSDAHWGVKGVVAAYVPGQRVTLHVFDNGALVLSRTVRVHRDGAHGVFRDSLRIGGTGRLTVRAIHFATPAQRRLVSAAFSLWLVAPQVYPGEVSYAVRILQHQLSARHYVIGAPGVYDARTQRAVLAFRKMAGLVRDADGLTELLGDPHPLVRLIASGALARTESRGAHRRRDFPELDPGFDRRHITLVSGRETTAAEWL